MKLKAIRKCEACPEQYDVVNEETGQQVGYLRLRWGYFYAACPDAGGEEVYSHDFDEEFKGVFQPDEREYYLNQALAAIEEAQNAPH